MLFDPDFAILRSTEVVELLINCQFMIEEEPERFSKSLFFISISYPMMRYSEHCLCGLNRKTI